MTIPFQLDEFRVCVFRLAGQNFGVRLEVVSAIVPMAELSRPPSMPSILEGFLNLGGIAIPVVKIAGLLGLPEERLALHTPLMIIRRGTRRMALLVNCVTHIADVAVGGMVPIAAADSFNGCVEGRLTAADQAVHVLSMDRLLLAEEQQVLAEFEEAESRRLSQIDRLPS